MSNENKSLSLLVNGKSTKELTTVEVHSQIKESVLNYLKENRFNYIVTSSNLKEVKANNTELNKSIKTIKEFGKNLVEKESADIVAFKANIKEYFEEIEAKRQARIKDVQVFEDETRNILKELTISYIKEQFETLKVQEQFQKLEYLDLIIISNLTASGALTKGIKSSLDMRIQQCKTKQDKYEMRLLKLENTCYQKGLEIPLTLNHVQGFIFDDDDSIYEEKLNKLISDEIARNEQIKAQMKARAEQEAKNAVNAQIAKANNIFLNSWGAMDLNVLESKIKEIENYDISCFNLCIDHAKALKDDAINFINQNIWSKKKALEETKKAIEDTISYSDNNKIVAPHVDTTIAEDVTPFDNIAIEENMVTNSDERIINAKFKINGTSGLSDSDIISAIKDILFAAGVDKESLISLEVE